jgi:hypothetical protein
MIVNDLMIYDCLMENVPNATIANAQDAKVEKMTECILIGVNDQVMT